MNVLNPMGCTLAVYTEGGRTFLSTNGNHKKLLSLIQ
jgi:hypothetical protein